MLRKGHYIFPAGNRCPCPAFNCLELRNRPELDDDDRTDCQPGVGGLGATNNFKGRSTAIVAGNGDIVTTNYLDVGGVVGRRRSSITASVRDPDPSRSPGRQLFNPGSR